MREVRAGSLRNRMLVVVLGTVAVAWICAAAFAYRDARHEADELLDGYLVQSAALVLMGSEGGAEELDLEHAPQLHRYARRVVFQIWDRGTHLRTHSASAPDRRLSSRDEGFDDVVIDGRPWRVFSTRSAEGDVLVQVGEQRHARDDIALAIARNLAVPLLVALPLVGLLVSLAIGFGMRPLRALGKEVAARDPANLAPLQAPRVPREVAPLVASLDALFERVQTLLEQERRFTADAAHELRTPVAALRAQAEVALASADEEERAKALRGVLAGCDRAAHLIDQLLTLARLDPARIDATPEAAERTDLAAVARDVAADAAQLAYERGVELSLDAAAPVPVALEPTQLRILLRNLVDNAVRYCGGAGHHVEVRVSAADGPVCEVIDDGPGLPPAVRARLGERFHRGEAVDPQGSGLGWSIVRRIAELCHAQLDLASGPAGTGLKVTVRFAAQRPRSAAPQALAGLQ